MITSTANEKVKHVVSLSRKAGIRQEEGVFLIEGSRIFAEAPLSLVKEVYVAESYLKKTGRADLNGSFQTASASCTYKQTAPSDLEVQISEKLGKTGFELVSDQVFQKLSDTKTPQGILAVLQQPVYEKKELFGKSPLLLILEDIQDPGNLGTIFRTAEGAGVTGIIMSRNCVDIYNPKVVRSTMGSIFRIPFYVTDNIIQEIKLLQKETIRIFAAHLRGERFYDEEDYKDGTAFLIGNEGNGLRAETAEAADALIKIPMQGKVESLNAGISAALLVYEAARQRRK